MKTPFVFLSIILFSVLLCEASKSPNPVLDINGKVLRANTKYYVVPLHDLIGGGLDLASVKARGDDCPHSVVQDKANRKGMTIQLYPVNSKKGVIRESTDLNIAFPDAQTKCPAVKNVWTIEGDVSWYDDTQYITIGGRIGNPGEQTLVNWFKIVKTPNAYKLSFCPDVCSSCDFLCQDVSVSKVGGHNILVLNNPALEFNFREA